MDVAKNGGAKYIALKKNIILMFSKCLLIKSVNRCDILIL